MEMPQFYSPKANDIALRTVILLCSFTVRCAADRHRLYDAI